MEVEIGRGKKARRAYGFDDIAIVPSRRTRDPDDVDITWTLGPYRFELPLLASAMDGVVSPETAGILGRRLRADDAIHRRGQQRELEAVRAQRPGDVDVVGIARPPRRHDRDVVEPVGPSSLLAATDLDFHRL